MPDLPKAPEGWPAFVTLSYAAQEAAERPVPRLDITFYVLTWFLGAIALLAVGHQMVAAMRSGEWKALGLLALIHLPWVALGVRQEGGRGPIIRLSNLVRSFAGAWRKAPGERTSTGVPKYVVLTQSNARSGVAMAGSIIGIPIHLADNGIQFMRADRSGEWKPALFQGWDEIERFAYQGEVGRFFRVRFYAGPFRRKEAFPEWERLVIALLPAVLTPTVTGFLFLHCGSLHSGFLAVFLTAFYVCALAAMAKMIISAWVRRNANQTHDILIENTVVSASELLHFLERRIGSGTPGEQETPAR